MRLMYNILLFAIFLNVACWLVQVFGLTGMNIPAQFNPLDVKAMFSIEVFASNFLWVGIGAVAAGIGAFIFRQNTYALYALVVFVIGIFFPIISKFIYAIPNLIDTVMFLYPEYNPLSGVATGVFAGTNPYSLIFIAIGTFAGFFFFADKLTGGQTA